MSQYLVRRARHFAGKPIIPGDKSISHRGLIFGALAEGVTEVSHILESEDVQSTQRCLEQMGIKVAKTGGKTWVTGGHLTAPKNILDCGNSGTTIRLLMGVLAGQNFKCELTGDSSLMRRPMKRVATPLREMGAAIELTKDNFAPMKISGGRLQGINYELKVASAQIKTAIILAGLLANGKTTITGEIESRDHTERLLAYFGAELQVSKNSISILGGQKLKAKPLQVPGDPSTAAFWLAAACLVPGSQIEMENISLNPTRTGFIRVLERMGAPIETKLTATTPEPIGTLKIGHANLRGTTVEAHEVPSLIDEIPMLAVLASQANGVTEVKGAEELRVKESDRLDAVAKNLLAMGIKIDMRPDGFLISGPQKLKGAEIESFHDHRIAMAFAVGGLVADGETTIKGSECVGISYPEFYGTLENLTRS